MMNRIKYENESKELPSTAVITEENDYNTLYFKIFLIIKFFIKKL
jgi:hypothetical protein